MCKKKIACHKLVIISVFAAIITMSSHVFAGMIYVAPDVNAFSGSNSSGALAEILNGNSTTGVVAGNFASLSNFLPHATWNTLPNFSSGALATVDLLAIGGPSYFQSGALTLTTSDINNVKDFLESGGDVLLQVESETSSHLSSYNSFLTGIGSSIQFIGSQRSSAATFSPSFFTCAACNILTGGTETRATFTSGTFIGDLAFASEDITPNQVPEPVSLSLLALGLLGFGATRRTKKLA